MKASPITTRTKPAICSICGRSRTTARSRPRRRRGGRRRSVKPATNGRLASATRRAAPALAELTRLDRGHGREVAGDERQDAGRRTIETKPARNATGIAPRSRRRSGRARRRPALELRVERRGPRRVADRLARAAAPAPGEQRRARARRSPSPTSGSTHASRLKPCFDGSASTAGPNCDDELPLISLFVSPAAIRAEMNCLIRSRDRRRRLVERRLAGRAHDLALELAERRVALARAPPAPRARARAASDDERPHDASAA